MCRFSWAMAIFNGPRRDVYEEEYSDTCEDSEDEDDDEYDEANDDDFRRVEELENQTASTYGSFYICVDPLQENSVDATSITESSCSSEQPSNNSISCEDSEVMVNADDDTESSAHEAESKLTALTRIQNFTAKARVLSLMRRDFEYPSVGNAFCSKGSILSFYAKHSSLAKRSSSCPPGYFTEGNRTDNIFEKYISAFDSEYTSSHSRKASPTTRCSILVAAASLNADQRRRKKRSSVQRRPISVFGSPVTSLYAEAPRAPDRCTAREASSDFVPQENDIESGVDMYVLQTANSVEILSASDNKNSSLWEKGSAEITMELAETMTIGKHYRLSACLVAFALGALAIALIVLGAMPAHLWSPILALPNASCALNHSFLVDGCLGSNASIPD